MPDSAYFAYVFFLFVIVIGVAIYKRISSSSSHHQSSYTGNHTATNRPESPTYPEIRIAVPADTRWDPVQAVGFMNSLFAIPHQMNLIVIADHRHISWCIRTKSNLAAQQIIQAVRSYYPQAEVEKGAYRADLPVDAPSNQLSSSIYLTLGVPDYFPLAYAKDLHHIDPLSTVVASMTNLEAGERVAYMITIPVKLADPHYDFAKAARKAITNRPGWGEIALAIAAVASDTKVTVSQPRSRDKYVPHLQRLAEEKIAMPTQPAYISFAVVYQCPSRRKILTHNMLNAFSAFRRDSGNYLKVTESNTTVSILTAQELAALWHLPSGQIQAVGVVRSSGAKAPLPVELVQQNSGLLLGNNTYQGVTRPIYLPEPDRITHMNIIGKTRVGKTTFMHNLIRQDIAAGRGVAVIDPHGDLIRDILETSIPPEREEDVVPFDLADTRHPVPLNLLYVPPGVPRHAAVGLTLGVLKKIFAEQWSATRMEDALYSALSALVDVEGATIRDISKLFLDEDYRADVLAQAHDEVALEFWHEDYGRMSERHQLEVARPIMNRIRAFYRNPVIRQIVDQPSSIDLRSIMDEGKILLVSLAGEATQAEAGTMGALLISKIQMAAMSRASMPAEQRRMFYLYIDELQNFITTSLPVMFSEAAKYALSLTVANQFLQQLAGDTLEAVMGNTGTTVMFACGAQDARDLGTYVKPVFDSETLMNLDRFQAIVKMQQSGKTLPAFSMMTPPPPAKPQDAGQRAERIRSQALADYAQGTAEVQEAQARATPDLQPSEPEPDKADDIPSLDL
jgi:hypothetical protein